MSKREREENGDGGGEEKRKKMSGELKVLKALENKDVRKVEAILRSEFKCVQNYRFWERKGETNLHFAIFLGYVDVIKALLQNGANVNAVNDEKQTPLHLLAEFPNVDVAKVLLQNGANMNAVDY